MRDDVDPKLRQRAATMRKAPTEPERRLWWALRHSLKLEGTHFRRQVVIGGRSSTLPASRRERLSNSMASSMASTGRSPTMLGARLNSRRQAGEC
jgi:hypothetical protein